MVLFALYHHHCHLYHTCKVFIFPSWRCILSNNWQKEPKEVYLRISVLVCRSCCGTWVHARLEFWLTHRVFIFLPQRINGICPEWPQEIFPTSEFIFPDSFTSSEFLHCLSSTSSKKIEIPVQQHKPTSFSIFPFSCLLEIFPPSNETCCQFSWILSWQMPSFS